MCNPEKVVDKDAEEILKTLVDYDANEIKTEQGIYVSGIRCNAESAVEVMSRNLKLNKKGSDRVAYHAYQSFKPGECDARIAHDIGMRFAHEMWGENFPVLISTHVDRGHLHNHFAIPATGFDGRRFHADGQNYRKMREVSDRLCLEYGLSVIKSRGRGNTRHIGEIKAEQEGRPTVRGIIRRDMDEAIKHCFSFKQFFNTFQSLGYTLEWRGKYLRIRPDKSSKWFRMDKLGKGYSYEDVEERLRKNAVDRTFTPYIPYVNREKPKGLHALYIHYCYLLGELPKTKPNNREAYAVIKEDVRRARMYSEEAKLLGKYSINTAEELSSFTENLSDKFKGLAIKRAGLRNKLRRMRDTQEMQPIKDEISELSRQMAVLRKEMKLCEDIALRSGIIEQVVNTIDVPDRDKPTQDKNRKKEDRKV